MSNVDNNYYLQRWEHKGKWVILQYDSAGDRQIKQKPNLPAGWPVGEISIFKYFE